MTHAKAPLAPLRARMLLMMLAGSPSLLAAQALPGESVQAIAWSAPALEGESSLRPSTDGARLQALRQWLDSTTAADRSNSWVVFGVGAVAGAVGGAFAGRALWCPSASYESQCTAPMLLTGALGAAMGGFLAWAIEDIVDRKKSPEAPREQR